MKKTIFILCLIIAIYISGCDNKMNGDGKSENATIDQSSLNEAISIYNIDGELIKEHNIYGSIHLVNDSLIYSQIPNGQIDEIASIDYYRYFFDTDVTVKLGSVERWSYESRYNTAYCNNSLYLFITTIVDNDYSVCLYTIDLIENDLTMLFSEKNVSSYNSMAVAGDKLLITYPLVSGGSVLEEYNTVTHERNIVLNFDFDNETDTGVVIRQITSDNDKTVSLLLLKSETDGKKSVYADIYELNLSFLQQVNLDAISNDSEEIRQPVSCFYYSNDYLYYENFSTTRFFGEIIENTAVSIMELSGDFAMVAELEKNKTTWLFYESFTNDIYLFNTSSGEINKTSYYANDTGYTITYMLRAGNDSLLVTMDKDGIDTVTGGRFPKKLYYFHLSDLA